MLSHSNVKMTEPKVQTKSNIDYISLHLSMFINPFCNSKSKVDDDLLRHILLNHQQPSKTKNEVEI